jgi:hypothetical protein
MYSSDRIGGKNMAAPAGYPSNYEEFKGREVYGHGGVRIYAITPEQAKTIHKELKLDFDLQQHRLGDQYYYLNQAHGEHHIIFSFHNKERADA